ncbi:hypothetical protein ANCCEY_00481 [Ancylostoma ceylanicum]|uniref:Peptidase M13 N-terminal domain-containing protein n=1 Tax=Ancylostoma ceylanicum TaxID=53326 RepID=A0A0D6M8C3_9BILA|nr:hypothetical protein ANCCEY_00481 [Ancylostoma ceylanicum]
MDKKTTIFSVISAVLIIAGLGTLGVSIATLVKVLSKEEIAPPAPLPQKDVNSLNIHSPKQIEPGNAKYSGYKQMVELFKASLNSSVNPCDDFYQYACGNFKGEMSFVNVQMDNLEKMREQLNDKNYVKNAPRPVKTLAWFYEKCVAARMNWADAVLNSNVVMKAVQDLAAGNKNYPEETKFPFYMLFQNETVKNFPTPRGLSYLLGHLAGVYGVPTIVPMSVDTNWKDPYGKNGYSLFIDQPGTMLPQIGHSRSWDILKPGGSSLMTSSMLAIDM